MTDKQFSAIRTVIIGAAFFIGGAIVALINPEYGTLFMILGGLLLAKDVLIRGLIWFLNFDGNMPQNSTETEKKDDNNDSY